jgi:hypothetical protein
MFQNPCCANVGCDGSCMPEFMQTVYKTTNSIPRAYRRQFLLKPGTIVANEQCKFDYRKFRIVWSRCVS